ncbi:MAG: PASTA domain-containing protein, partial [Actinomycetota bacterium]
TGSPSQGTSVVLAPETAGLAVSEARQMLADLGLGVEISRRSSNDVEEGLVIDQAPPAGSQVEMGTTVTLLVSVGIGSEPASDFGEAVFQGRTNDCFWTLYVEVITGGDGGGLMTLATPEGDVLEQLLVGTSGLAPALQIRSFTCETPQTGVLAFGLASPQVAELEWQAAPDAVGGPPDCIDSPLPEGFCLMLEDFNAGGEVVAFDAEGREIGRSSFG